MRKHYFIYRVVCSINNITIHLPTFQEQLAMILIATLQVFSFGNKYYTYQQSKYTLAKMLRWIVIVILTTYFTRNFLKVNHPP